MQGYAFIDQSSIRAPPHEAERAGEAACEAGWGHGVGHGGKRSVSISAFHHWALSGRDVGL